MESVLKNYWDSQTKVPEIIKLIPIFVERSLTNVDLGTQISYGNYIIGYRYTMNLFISNPEFRLHRALIHQSDPIYLLITESNLLIFEPDVKIKSEAYLSLCVNLTKLKLEDFNSDSNTVKTSKIYKLSILFESTDVIKIYFQTLEEGLIFEDMFETAKSNLLSKYKTFHDDILSKKESNLGADKYHESICSLDEVQPKRLHKRSSDATSKLMNKPTELSLNKSFTNLNKNTFNSKVIKEASSKEFEYTKMLKHKLTNLIQQENESSISLFLVKEIIYLYQKLVELTYKTNPNIHYEFKSFIERESVKHILNEDNKNMESFQAK